MRLSGWWLNNYIFWLNYSMLLLILSLWILKGLLRTLSIPVKWISMMKKLGYCTFQSKYRFTSNNGMAACFFKRHDEKWHCFLGTKLESVDDVQRFLIFTFCQEPLLSSGLQPSAAFCSDSVLKTAKETSLFIHTVHKVFFILQNIQTYYCTIDTAVMGFILNYTVYCSNNRQINFSMGIQIIINYSVFELFYYL